MAQPDAIPIILSAIITTLRGEPTQGCAVTVRPQRCAPFTIVAETTPCGRECCAPAVRDHVDNIWRHLGTLTPCTRPAALQASEATS